MKVNTYLVSGLVGLTALSFLSLTSSFVFADSVVTTTTINVPESCTMSGTGMTSHTATLINGTYSGTDYSNGIGTTTLKVFCNDSAGFAIYAIGYTNDEYGNNKLHWSGASSASDDTNAISTDIYTSGVTTASTWSMKLAAVSGTYAATIDDGVATHNNSTENFTTWHTVPTEYKRVAYRLSGTDAEQSGAGTGSSITTTYDAYVSNIQPAGSYNGQVKYTLVHPSTAPEPPSLIMQDVASWKNSLSIGDEVQAIDSRDNKVYYVAKLADGNIWMIQNLDHDIDSNFNYNSTNTDIPSNWANNLPDTRLTSDTGWGEDNWDYTNDTPESYDPGDLCWTGEIAIGIPGPIGDYTVSCSQNGNHFHIGNYYNWTAAVAMEDSSSYTTDNTDINQSICPSGWMLPKSGATLTGSGSFTNLVNEYGWDSDDYSLMDNYTTWDGQFWSTHAGHWGGVSFSAGEHGKFWSSVVETEDTSYQLDIFGSTEYVNPTDLEYRYYGASVRCVARP